jgi:integrase/recombinase XerD
MTISEAYASFETYYLINNDRSEKTLKEYHVRFFGRNGLITVVGDVPIKFFGLDHIINWKLHMRNEGLQPVYINHNLSGLRQFLRWLQSQEFDVIDWHKIAFDKEETNKPHIVLTKEEITRLVSHAPTLRDKAIIKLFYGTGCRSAEELNLDRDQWNAAEIINKDEVNNGATPIWEMYVLGKNKKYRPVLYYQDVRDTVDAYLASRHDCFKPLFVSQQNRRISYAMVSRMLHETTRRAGLEKRVTQHTIRHSYATERGANGMPQPVLAYNLGHSNASITQRIYFHMNALHARKAYANS